MTALSQKIDRAQSNIYHQFHLPAHTALFLLTASICLYSPDLLHFHVMHAVKVLILYHGTASVGLFGLFVKEFGLKGGKGGGIGEWTRLVKGKDYMI